MESLYQTVYRYSVMCSCWKGRGDSWQPVASVAAQPESTPAAYCLMTKKDF